MLPVLKYGGLALAAIFFLISMSFVVRSMRAPPGSKGRYFFSFVIFDTLAIACFVVALIAFMVPEWFGFPPNAAPAAQ